MMTVTSRIRLLTALLATLLVGGCQHVNHLRDAQESFNTAAQLENQTRFETEDAERERQLQHSPGQGLAALTTIQAGYGAAVQSLREADVAKLRQDKLLGAALTLQALAEWRLGHYGASLATKDRAEKEASDQIYPRDAATLAALPGLIKTDLANAKVLKMGEDRARNEVLFNDEIKPSLVGGQGAVSDLQLARGKIERDHPMQVYLIQCQLAVYRNYQVAHQKAHGSSPRLDDPAHQAAEAQLKELTELLKGLKLESLGSKMVAYWGGYNLRPPSQ